MRVSILLHHQEPSSVIRVKFLQCLLTPSASPGWRGHPRAGRGDWSTSQSQCRQLPSVCGSYEKSNFLLNI